LFFFCFFLRVLKSLWSGFFVDGHRTLTTEFVMNKEWSNLRSLGLGCTIYRMTELRHWENWQIANKHKSFCFKNWCCLVLTEGSGWGLLLVGFVEF
jgi:hypothetical protein